MYEMLEMLNFDLELMRALFVEILTKFALFYSKILKFQKKFLIS